MAAPAQQQKKPAADESKASENVEEEASDESQQQTSSTPDGKYHAVAVPDIVVFSFSQIKNSIAMLQHRL
jgi:hypothetical protein